MKIHEILEMLNKHMPLNLAMGFDNVGLLVGRSEREVKRIYLAVDATMDVVDAAIEENADLILTHHPLIFGAMKRVVDEDITGRRVLKLIENHIALMSMHTNYDIAKNCMVEAVAKKLGIEGEVLEVTDTFESEGETISLGIGIVGEVNYSLEELVFELKKRFSLDFVRIYGKDRIKSRLHRIAVSPGSGKGMYPVAVKKNAQVLITGDITHHEGIDAREAGICIIDAGHFGMEKVFLEDMQKKLNTWLHGADIKVIVHNEKCPDEIM